VGLITGDIKTNPDAEVLIMTTEILLNKLYQVKSSSPAPSSSISFEMDIELELGCVVFDEVHFITDESRGHVWEQSIMMLPPQVQMIGLSATLDDPTKFAYWLENRGSTTKFSDKEVFLTQKQIRAVPLIHYSFITATNGVNKHIKDKTLQQEIRSAIDKPYIIQDANGVFNDTQYQTTNKILKLFEKHEIRVKRQHVLNKVTEYLVEKEMLPALCYVFSRKQLEKCAEELTTNLLEFDSKIPYTVDRECEQIIRKLPNFEEYLHLPEYLNTVKLLRKGIGIHHAGLMPILREMTELLFARGFIKILFCTETMSVGINLPVKTTIFTDVNKFNGEINRTLYSHEYTQAAGRAGRLGLDNVGHVIHLNNLFRNVDSVGYKAMMNGKPQTLSSKFKISYNLLLNLLDIGDNNLVSFASRSMVTGDLDNQMKQIHYKITTANTKLSASKAASSIICLLFL
jgi:superfamily II RNA helicase